MFTIVAYEWNHELLISQLQLFTQALPRAADRAEFAVAKLILESTKQVMKERIYYQPLPKSYARWGVTHRTGALYAAEVMLLTGESYLITTEDRGQPRPNGMEHESPEDYAVFRHYASGEDWVAGLWREEGVKVVENQIEPTFVQEMSRNIPGALLSPD